MIVKCEYCNKNINRPKWRLETYKHQFCSKKCSDEFSKKDKLKRKCLYCKKEFEFLESRLKHSNRNYCSPKCFFEYNRKGIIKQCLICRKDIYVTPSKIKDSRGKYCSRICVAKSQIGPNGNKWKDGYALFKSYSESLINKKCSTCQSDKHVDLHHKDGNKHNNESKDNWILLCRSCHMRIHKLVKRFNISYLQAFKILEKDKIFNLTPYEFANYAPASKLLLELDISVSG